MPILFSAVARGSLILAKFASCSGNFTDAVHQILPKISPHQKKLSYAIGDCFFHYIAENKLIYFCITDKNFHRPTAFAYLDEIKRKFLASFEGVSPDSVPFVAVSQKNDGVFNTILQVEMSRYNNNMEIKKQDKTHLVKAELEALKSIMVENVAKVAVRGERLESLMSRTDGLTVTTNSFRRTAVRVQRKYWWQNIKMQIIMVLVLGVLIYGCGAAACGGLKWSKCVK